MQVRRGGQRTMTIQEHAIISDEEVTRIAAVILAHWQAAMRGKALKVREAMLADLRAFEDMYGLPRSVPTLREQGKKDGYIPKEREEG